MAPPSIKWVVYQTTTDLDSYPTSIYRLSGPFDTPQQAWEYQAKFGGQGVFMVEPPMEEINRRLQ